MERAPRQRRPRGTGSIYPVGNGFMIAYRKADGKRQREFFTTKSEAQRTLRKRVGAKEHGLPVIPGVEKLTWEDGVKVLTDHGTTIQKKSLDEDERRLRLHLSPYFTGRRLIGIATSDVRAYTAARKKDTIVVRKERRDEKDQVVEEEKRRPVSNGEINRELQLLKHMLRLMRDEGKLPSVPKIELLPEDAAVRTGFLDRAQVDAVCKHLEPEIADVVRFAFFTGWRIASEVLPLEWRQVDFDANEIRLDAGSTKNKAGRVFPLTADLRKLLKARWADHEKLKKAGTIERWVFWRMVAEGRGGDKKPQPIVRFDKSWKAACVAAGLPGRIPHDLRRSAIRNFVRRGISEHTAMKLSGHKTPSIFRRYDIVSPEDLREAARKLDQQPGSRRGKQTA